MELAYKGIAKGPEQLAEERRLREMTENDEEGDEEDLLLALDLAGAGGEVDPQGSQQQEDDDEEDRMPPQQRAAQEKVVHFAKKMLGVTAVHPQPDPAEWPKPEGRNPHKPPANVLRERLLDSSSHPEYNTRYMHLINRVMLHSCRVGYCQNEKRRDKAGELICRFSFPKSIHGFTPDFGPAGDLLRRLERNASCPEGAEILEGSV